jgi:EmrB/QacA subfamily drug resistance transporter
LTTQERTEERTSIGPLIIGTMLAMLLAQLDGGILSTALPRVVGDLGGLDNLSWVFTAYMLTLTASTPLYGKLGDLYGRKGIFLASIAIFLIGSMGAGLSQSLGMLIGFRALQGLGAGGLVVNVIAVIGEVVPKRERGKYQSYVAVLGIVAVIAGPLLGGVFTDYLSWRWAFFVNVPIGIVSMLLVGSKLHLAPRRVEHRIDYGGALALAVASVALVLMTSWGGNRYAWGSPVILLLAALTVIAVVAVVLIERRAGEPILPLRLFRIGNFTAGQVIAVLVGFGMYGATAFLPLYQQTVHHSSATNSGLLLLPFLAGSMVTTLLGGKLTERTGNYRALLLCGAVPFALGAYLLSRLGLHTGNLEAVVAMLVYGLGLGLLYQVVTVTVQNSIEQRHLGVASGSVTFFRMIGGSFGVALFGSIFAQQLVSTLTARLGAQQADALTAGGGQLDPAKLNGLAAPVRAAYTEGVANGTHHMFLWAVPFAVVAVIAAAFVKRVAIDDGDDVPPADPPAHTQPAHTQPPGAERPSAAKPSL